MKYQQQVSVDLVNMVYTAIAYLALAGGAWLLLRLIQACFWLPNHMKRRNDVQTMLQDKVESYERYVKECEAKEEAGEVEENGDERSLEERRKERQDCLDMLKRELKRISEGGDPYDFDYLLDEEDKKLLEESDKENDEGEGKDDGDEDDKQQSESEAKDKIAEKKEELSVKEDKEPKKTK